MKGEKKKGERLSIKPISLRIQDFEAIDFSVYLQINCRDLRVRVRDSSENPFPFFLKRKRL